MSQFMRDLFQQMAGGGGKCEFYWQTCTTMWVTFRRITLLYWKGVVVLPCSKQSAFHETSCRETPTCHLSQRVNVPYFTRCKRHMGISNTAQVTGRSITQPMNWLQVSRCMNRVA